MAITRATNLAAVGSGLGTGPAQPIDVGIGITLDGNSGVITATSRGNFGSVTIDGSSTGIITATTFSGTATNAGTAVNLGVGATGYGLVLSGDLTAANVTVGGTLTYDDVTNIDSVGLITARNGLQVLAGITTISGQANLANVNVSAAATVAGSLKVGSNTLVTPDANADNLVIDTGDVDSGISILSATTGRIYFGDAADDEAGSIRYVHSDNSMRFETNSTEALRVDSSLRLLVGTTSNVGDGLLQIQGDAASSLHGGSLFMRRGEAPGSISSGELLGQIVFTDNAGGNFGDIKCEADAAAGTDDFPGRLVFRTTADGASSLTERLRITSRGGFQFSNGFMSETVKINTTARNGTQAVNLDEGMAHYFSTNSAGTWKPNFTMSAGDDINATIAIGDVFSPTMIVAKGATTHFANAIQVDGSDVTPEFSGGAPTDGGGSGTFDVYNYTIIKTGDDTFKAFAAVSTYE